MRGLRTALLTTIAMLAFAGNSILCRLALSTTAIDAASFTAIRLLSGALVLAVLVSLQGARPHQRGNWPSALALFAYAAAFSYAYLSLTAATGALLLFGAVQVTMIGWGLCQGERIAGRRLAGLVLAITGLVGLLLPGLQAPPVTGACLMLAAGIAWGVYSLRGRGRDEPTLATAGNFLRATAPALLLVVVAIVNLEADLAGVAYAVASGAIASGIGYAIWYSALPHLSAATAATVQLSVPALAAAGGVAFLGEPMTLRLWLASAAILGGVALFIHSNTHRP